METTKKWLWETFQEVSRKPENHWRAKEDYYFKDNGSKILGVAHTDAVIEQGAIGKMHHKGDDYFLAPNCDDRVGVWTMTKVLPKLGINIDVLLTTDEEIGRSTGAQFALANKKKYNWMFMFDRGHNDVVLYQYLDDKQWHNSVAKFWDLKQIGSGSYSCIADMDDLECCGLNVGCYEDGHSIGSYMNLTKYLKQLAKFQGFYRKYKNTRFKWAEPKYTSYQPQIGMFDRDNFYGDAYEGSLSYPSYENIGGVIRRIDHKRKTDSDWTGWSKGM